MVFVRQMKRINRFHGKTVESVSVKSILVIVDCENYWCMKIKESKNDTNSFAGKHQNTCLCAMCMQTFVLSNAARNFFVKHAFSFVFARSLPSFARHLNAFIKVSRTIRTIVQKTTKRKVAGFFRVENYFSYFMTLLETARFSLKSKS